MSSILGLLLLVWCLEHGTSIEEPGSIDVYHFIDNPNWGETDGSALEGEWKCPGVNKICRFTSTDPKGVAPKDLMNNLVAKYSLREARYGDALTVGLYSIHSWAPVSPAPHHPDKCSLPTDINIAESEESYSRFRKLFDGAFPGYHGNSTTHPMSGPVLQRTYVSEFKADEFLPTVPFEQKIKGATYVASTCHNRAHKMNLRETIVSKLERGYRVDSLGRCHRGSANGKDAVTLQRGSTPAETLRLKQRGISRYLFHLAFENTVEPGYVTEKVFDALKAGTVPVYLGPKADCLRLVPYPDAIIFVEDFLHRANDQDGGNGVKTLAGYLQHLSTNRTAYEAHLQWRQYINNYRDEGKGGKGAGGTGTDSHYPPNGGIGGYNYPPGTGKTTALLPVSPLLATPWTCRVCAWADGYAREHGIRPGSARKAAKNC